METKQTKVERFNFNAETIEQAKEYLVNRAIQLLRFGVVLIEIKEYSPYCVVGIYKYGKRRCQSIYMLKQARNKGKYREHFEKELIPVITTYDCDIENFLVNKKYPYKIINTQQWYEYELISKAYGSNKAKRSGVFLMNHIDEGLAILEFIKASEAAKRAYCLHPLIQSDDQFHKNFDKLNSNDKVDKDILNLAVEYRKTANAYLSKREIESLDDIELSEYEEVNEMLIADKIQNKKDFDIYHRGTHPRSKELDQYFNNWLEKLDVAEYYQDYKSKITINVC